MFDSKATCGAANTLSKAISADVLIYNGGIDEPSCRKFIDLLCARSWKKILFLVLVIPGGNPDAAFKIGRAMQAKYELIQIYIPGWCKSAGTLVALAANRIVIGDRGELGPLDIQIAKADEIMEMGSGLAVDAAMKSLEISASKMFLNLLLTIRRDTGGTITTRTAAELASTMVVKLLDPIYRQIDPMKIGENSRAMNITKAYGSRLNMKSHILRTPRSLDFLVSAYPDHGFVIDRSEALGLFADVSEPTPEMVVLSDALAKRRSRRRRNFRQMDSLISPTYQMRHRPPLPRGQRPMHQSELRPPCPNDRQPQNPERTATLQTLLEAELDSRLLMPPVVVMPPQAERESPRTAGR